MYGYRDFLNLMNENSTRIADASYLVSRLRKGDERAFRTLYDTYHQRLYGFSLKFTHSSEDAQEVVQNTFLKLWEYRARLDPKRPLEPYLYQIAKNENLKYLQKVARNAPLREAAYQQMKSASSTVEQDVIFAEYEAIAERAVASLPPKRKLVYEMAHQQGKTVKEIAATMGISSQTVRTQLTQALQAIKVYLKQHADISFSLAFALLTRFW